MLHLLRCYGACLSLLGECNSDDPDCIGRERGVIRWLWSVIGRQISLPETHFPTACLCK